ncbi:MAG TPA: nucleotidyltransferase family protein [Candidatus Acidoferrales bacterium]|nr:nucleotidyltransferase family protein [Candidatus Acidoferrales bacterium]
MILAAGMGSRLRPLTDYTPKPLIEVAGRPMIAFPLQLLRNAGIQDVVINLHHLGEQIRDTLGDGGRFGLRIHYSPEEPILDSGGGIAAAREHLGSGTFVILNADTFIDVELAEVIDFHRRHDALGTLLLRADRDAVRRDDIGIDAGGRIRRFLGQGASNGVEPPGEPLRRCFYGGVMVFEPRFFDYLPLGIYSITRDVLPRVMAAGEPLYGYLHSGYWRVLDTPQDLEAGRQEIAARLHGKGEFR